MKVFIIFQNGTKIAMNRPEIKAKLYNRWDSTTRDRISKASRDRMNNNWKIYRDKYLECLRIGNQTILRENRFGHHKYKYKNYLLRSSYELKLAKILTYNNIKFEYEPKNFIYTYKNKTHIYYPDFYLTDYNLYLEVKPKEFILKELNMIKIRNVRDSGSYIEYITEEGIFNKDFNILDFIHNILISYQRKHSII